MITGGMGIWYIIEQNERDDDARKAAERRARIEARYQREIADARARNMPDTAAAIEAERAEWLAALDATANN